MELLFLKVFCLVLRAFYRVFIILSLRTVAGTPLSKET